MTKLTLRQIKSTIEALLQSKFPGVTVHKTGVQEKFDRPSYFVRLDNIGSDDHLYNRMRTIGVEVRYFPSDRYQHTLELLDVQDALEDAFGLNLAIGDRTVVLDSKGAAVVDGVLHFPFTFSYFEDQSDSVPGPPETLMQELKYDG